MRLYLRGRTWWTWFYDASGQRVRRTTRCRDRDAAEIAAARMEREAQRGIEPRSDSDDEDLGEIGVMLVLEDLLENLDPRTRERVLRWALDRWYEPAPVVSEKIIGKNGPSR